MSAHGVKLLIDLFTQYRGGNNGDLAAAWPIMKSRGWTSKATLYRALNELREARWIVVTRQGGAAELGARRVCSLYAVTWKQIDYCDGKLDVQHTNTPSNTWKKIKTAAPPVDPIGPPAVPIQGANDNDWPARCTN